MRPQSLITRRVIALLKNQRKPKTMRWILEKMNVRGNKAQHRAIWNSVHNGCVCPAEKPRFKKSWVDKKKTRLAFEINR